VLIKNLKNGPLQNALYKSGQLGRFESRRKSRSSQVFSPQDPTERPLALARASSPAQAAHRPADNLALSPARWKADIPGSPGIEDKLNLRPSLPPNIPPRHPGFAGIQEGVGKGGDDLEIDIIPPRHPGIVGIQEGVGKGGDGLEIDIDLGEASGFPGAGWGLSKNHSLWDSGEGEGRSSRYPKHSGMQRDEVELLETGLWSP
jgi:hypothetical protein